MGRLTDLSGNVAVSDFRPNDQQGQVHLVLKERLDRIQQEIEEVLEGELADEQFDQVQTRNLVYRDIRNIDDLVAP